MGGSCTVLLAFDMRCVAPATDSMMVNSNPARSCPERTGCGTSGRGAEMVSLSRRQRHLLGASATLRAWQPPGLSQQRDGARVPTATSTSPDASRESPWPRFRVGTRVPHHQDASLPERMPVCHLVGWGVYLVQCTPTHACRPAWARASSAFSSARHKSRRGRRGCAAPPRGHGHQMFAITGGSQVPRRVAPRGRCMVAAHNDRHGQAALARFHPMSTDCLHRLHDGPRPG
jgi:hypothetical protein